MSREALAGHALVVGAGIGGMLTARVLAEHCERVTLLERDELPWGVAHRAGAPQDRHGHGVLRGGLDCMNALMPGLEDALHADGALRHRPARDILLYDSLGLWPRQDAGPTIPAQTRPLLEHHLRKGLAGFANVTVEQGNALDLCMQRRRVVGLTCQRGAGARDRVAADLVVDATGRVGVARRWLVQAGFEPPEETSIQVDLGYGSCFFAVPDDAPDIFGAMVSEGPPKGRRGGLVIRQDGGRYLCGLGERGGQPPGDIDGYRAFAKSLPHPGIYDLIRSAEPLGPVRRFALRQSVQRHYERLQAFPEGFLCIGDAICSFNPMWGQGMSVAALEALRLRELLAARDSLSGLWRDFFPAAAAIIETPWALSALPDLAFDVTRGERPPQLSVVRGFSRAFARLAQLDDAVRGLLMDVYHLAARREELADPALVQRAMALA